MMAKDIKDKLMKVRGNVNDLIITVVDDLKDEIGEILKSLDNIIEELK